MILHLVWDNALYSIVQVTEQVSIEYYNEDLKFSSVYDKIYS